VTEAPPSPGEFFARIPTMPGGNTPWAVQYGRELREIIVRQAHRSPRNLQVTLGPSELGEVCLAGETEVVTRQGIRKIRDLAAEGSAELLVPMLYRGSNIRKRWGRFLHVPVECFGEQELYEIILHRNQETKTVFATAEHGWYRTYYSGKIKTQKRLETRDLLPGYKLTQLRRAMPRYTTLMPFAVAQGFTFGDGTIGSSDDRHRPATLLLFHNGKDEALLPFFPGEHKVYHHTAQAHPYSVVRGLPRFWKALPPLDESVSFLMSWLAGYFAADGHVGGDGHCSISSACRENLEFVRDAAAVCGVGYGQIRKKIRRGISGTSLQAEETPLYYLSLRRRDLPEWFFLTEQHGKRAKAASLALERDPHWIVESVRATGRTEPVYCAKTGEPGAFALADDLMTGNCPRQIVSKFSGQPETWHGVDPWASFVGTAVHAALADVFAKENNLDGLLSNGLPRWITEARVAPHPSYPGSADLYDVANHTVCDWKILGPTSIAKVKSVNGPPRRYKVQLLLYAKGYANLGFPVQRVVLAALPRTSPSLAEMYIWEHWLTPDDDILVSQVLAETQLRYQVAQAVMRREIPIEAVPRVPGDSCSWCFSGETEIVTRDGIRPIASLAGTTPELLVPRMGKNPGLQALGDFVRAPVREFGQQRLWEITLGNRRAEKVIYATAEHRWMLTPPRRPRTPVRYWPDKTTAQLQPGDQFRPLRAARPSRTELMPWAVAQGFVYGDGSRGTGNQPATLTIYDNGKDEALLPFFPFTEPKRYEGSMRIRGLPRFWKDLPPIRESRAFLLSWLAGYFAADGTVSKNGQVILSSAEEQAILFARDVAAVCGVGYSPPRSDLRLGRGQVPTLLWGINLRRRDLPDWFFLIKEHAVRAAAADEDKNRGTYWTVKSAEPTDRIETVYCATVPGAEMFGLADDLLTGNCRFYRPDAAREIRETGYQQSPGCPGHSPT
jgi:hypothetical protein